MSLQRCSADWRAGLVSLSEANLTFALLLLLDVAARARNAHMQGTHTHTYNTHTYTPFPFLSPWPADDETLLSRRATWIIRLAATNTQAGANVGSAGQVPVLQPALGLWGR